MNENLNLVEILKDCPKGIKLYSTIYGDVEFIHIENNEYPIVVGNGKGFAFRLAKDGKYLNNFNGECTLFPSKEQRDWGKFTGPWYKKDRFDPKTLNPFDKVLIRRSSENYNVWLPDFVSDPPNGTNNKTLCMCVMEEIAMVIPYNDETKHLLGTNEEAPEYYRYWED